MRSKLKSFGLRSEKWTHFHEQPPALLLLDHVKVPGTSWSSHRRCSCGLSAPKSRYHQHVQTRDSLQGSFFGFACSRSHWMSGDATRELRDKGAVVVRWQRNQFPTLSLTKQNSNLLNCSYNPQNPRLWFRSLNRRKRSQTPVEGTRQGTCPGRPRIP